MSHPAAHPEQEALSELRPGDPQTQTQNPRGEGGRGDTAPEEGGAIAGVPSSRVCWAVLQGWARGSPSLSNVMALVSWLGVT